MDELQKMLMSQYGMSSEVASAIAKNAVSTPRPQVTISYAPASRSGRDQVPLQRSEDGRSLGDLVQQHDRAAQNVFGAGGAARYTDGLIQGVTKERDWQNVEKQTGGPNSYTPNALRQKVGLANAFGWQFADAYGEGMQEGNDKAKKQKKALQGIK